MALAGFWCKLRPPPEQVLLHHGLVDLPVKTEGELTDGPGIERGFPKLPESRQEALDGALGKENPASYPVPVHNGLERPPLAEGDHGLAACHGLHRDDAEILLPGKDERAAPRVEVPHLVIGHFPDEPDRGTRHLPQAPVLRAIACDHKPVPAPVECGNRQVHPLVGNLGTGNQEVALITCAEREPAGLDRRVDHVGIPVIDRLDAAPHILGARHVVMRMECRGKVPSLQRSTHSRHGGADRERRPPRGEILVVEIPQIPHRREAIADVQRLCPRADALRHGVVERDDAVEFPQVESPDRRRKQREVVAVVGTREGKVLHERGARVHLLERGGDRSTHMQQAEECCLRKHLAQRLHASLPASHRGEPLVDDGNATRARHSGCVR